MCLHCVSVHLCPELNRDLEVRTEMGKELLLEKAHLKREVQQRKLAETEALEASQAKSLFLAKMVCCFSLFFACFFLAHVLF